MEIPERYRVLDPGKVTDPIFLDFLRKIPAPLQEGKSLFVTGNNGIGKTAFAALALMQGRRYGIPGLFIEAGRLKEYAFGREMFDMDQTYWERMQEVQFLVLDDLGKESEDTKNWMAQLMDQMMRHRMMHQLSTCITSNATPEDLVKRGTLWTSTLHAMKESTLFYNSIGEDMRGKLKKFKGENGKIVKVETL